MEQLYKLVAFDLDGTVMPMMGTEVSPSFMDAMQLAASQGITFAVFTGRSLTTIPQNICALPAVSYLCYANGSGIVERASGKCIYRSPMPHSLAIKVLDELSCYSELVLQVFTEGKVYYPRYAIENPEKYNFPPNHALSIRRGLGCVTDNIYQFVLNQRPSIDKLNIMRVEGALRTEIIQRLSHIEGLDVVSSGGVNLEFNSSTTNKGYALEFLASHLGLGMDEVLALGDNDNDALMLKKAGLGVALCNGSPAALLAASYITTLPVEADGAAMALEMFVLRQHAVI